VNCRKRETIADLTARLAEALDEDHHCDDVSCDIRAAKDAGLYLWAGHILEGATECPATERAMGRFRARVKSYQRRLDAERDALCESTHYTCDSCNSVHWTDDQPEDCEQCGARFPLSEPEEDSDDDTSDGLGTYEAGTP
jgi:hypothetical protein